MVVSYCYTYASPVAELPVAVGGAAPFRTHWSASLAVEAAPVAELRVVVGEGAPFRTRWSASLAVEASVLDVPRAMEAPPLGWSAVEVSPATICAERHSTTFSNLSALAFCFSSLAQIAELSISFLFIDLHRQSSSGANQSPKEDDNQAVEVLVYQDSAFQRLQTTS